MKYVCLIFSVVMLASCARGIKVTQTLSVAPNNAGMDDSHEAPRFIRSGVVRFPREAIDYHITGSLTTLVTIDAKGVPERVLIESRNFETPEGQIYSVVMADGTIRSMAEIFDASAIDAMMSSRFTPMKKNGISIESIVRVPVNFFINQSN